MKSYDDLLKDLDKGMGRGAFGGYDPRGQYGWMGGWGQSPRVFLEIPGAPKGMPKGTGLVSEETIEIEMEQDLSEYFPSKRIEALQPILRSEGFILYQQGADSISLTDFKGLKAAIIENFNRRMSDNMDPSRIRPILDQFNTALVDFENTNISKLEAHLKSRGESPQEIDKQLNEARELIRSNRIKINDEAVRKSIVSIALLFTGPAKSFTYAPSVNIPINIPGEGVTNVGERCPKHNTVGTGSTCSCQPYANDRRRPNCPQFGSPYIKVATVEDKKKAKELLDKWLSGLQDCSFPNSDLSLDCIRLCMLYWILGCYNVLGADFFNLFSKGGKIVIGPLTSGGNKDVERMPENTDSQKKAKKTASEREAEDEAVWPTGKETIPEYDPNHPPQAGDVIWIGPPLRAVLYIGDNNVLDPDAPNRPAVKAIDLRNIGEVVKPNTPTTR